MISAGQVRELVETELSRIGDAERRESLRAMLVEPHVEIRDWEYGESDERFPCWIVAEAPQIDVKLAYCESGFGPESPWGAVFVSDPSLGMDSQWHRTLDGVFQSFVWRRLYPNDTRTA